MRVRFICALCALVVVSGAHSIAALGQDFLPYEGKNAVREGDGGTKKAVDGVDFWSDGAPPHTFKLLGYISDRRHKSGLFGAIRMSGLESDIADVAKKNGGDAVILVSAEAETVGVVGNSHSTGNWSTGAATAVQKQQSKYAVVKYMSRDKPADGSNSPTSRPTASTTVESKPSEGATNTGSVPPAQ